MLTMSNKQKTKVIDRRLFDGMLLINEKLTKIKLSRSEHNILKGRNVGIKYDPRDTRLWEPTMR